MVQTGHTLRRFFFKGQWKGGGTESFCGGGSTMEATQYIRAALPDCIRRNGVKSFLGAPCGDFAWMCAVDLGDVYYIGMDIVEDFTVLNREKFAHPFRKFVTGDITTDLLAPVDMMMVRECLFHLPHAYIIKFFNNFLRSDIPLLLMTTQLPSANSDIDRPGRYRPLDLCKSPFNLPPPIEMLRDYLPGKSERYMGLWSREQIESALVKPAATVPS